MYYFSREALAGLAQADPVAAPRGSEVSASLFLCHCPEDQLVAAGLDTFIRMQGVPVLIDLATGRLPRRMDRVAAQSIKRGLHSSSHALFLMTKGSCALPWMPWTLGAADSLLDPDKISIVPLEDSPGDACAQALLLAYNALCPSGNSSATISSPHETPLYTLKEWLLLHGQETQPRWSRENELRSLRGQGGTGL